MGVGGLVGRLAWGGGQLWDAAVRGVGLGPRLHSSESGNGFLGPASAKSQAQIQRA